MPNELYTAKNLKEAKEKLRAIYKSRSLEFKEITPKLYKKIAQSEHEDSDNHFNEARLGKETQAIDLAYHKYLEDGRLAYRILYVDTKGKTEEDYFVIKPKPEYND